MNRYRDQWTGFTLEFFAAVFLIGLIAAVMLTLYRSTTKTADEGILVAQLRALRMQQKLFRVVHGREPNDLKELVYDDYSVFPLGGAGREGGAAADLWKPGAVLAVAANRSGDPVDPWGAPYVMDPETKRIYSGTKNYETW
jgi:type II secretory pathway pseudopilin PulG